MPPRTTARVNAPSGDLRRWAAGAAELLRRWTALAAGCAAGAVAAGWYGLLAGALIGAMLDLARAESAARRALAACLRDPEAPEPAGLTPGLPAAAAIALSGEWCGELPAAARRALVAEAARSLPGLCPPALPRRALARALEEASFLPARLLPALARRLATRGSPASRLFLARAAYALRAASSGRLDHASEAGMRLVLADCGLRHEELLDARAAAFPDYRDPWELLGLERGTPPDEVRRAWRRLSRRRHPDALAGARAGARAAGEGAAGECAAGEGGPVPDAAEADEAAARFRELREAYEAISRR